MKPIGREGMNALGLHPCVGYFDAPHEPCVYDPGWGSTPCLICWKPLGGKDGPNAGGNIRTIGLLHGDDNLSLFYRVHITCAEADPAATSKIDGSVMHGARDIWDSIVTPETLARLSTGEEAPE
jgi:hypothetical protein